MSEDNLDTAELHEEDNEIVEVEEAHDPENAEDQSVASVDAADDKGVPAGKKRKSDKTQKDPIKMETPKTKAGMINAMFSKLSSSKKEDVAAMYAKMHESIGEMEEDGTVEMPEVTYQFDAELESLVQSEATLSDEFKTKSAVIFETAIKSKLAEEVDRLEDEYQSKLEEESSASRTELVEKVDNYLNYVVEQWMEENKLAVETGLRTEIAEGFMNSLKDLFTENYISVPESKIDLVDELAVQVEELEEKLNTQTGSVLEMTEELETFRREEIIREHSRDLADTQIEKLRTLVDSLDFEDAEAFSSKVKTVKESYFMNESTSATVEEIAEDLTGDVDAEVESNSTMDMYLQAIKTINKE
jgi:hypothetical protein